MTENVKRILRQALEQYRGDNLYRAQAAFRGLTPEQMQHGHGQSGQTRQQILDGYQQHHDEVEAALRELETLR